MKSWKTTLFGSVAALGAYLSTIHDPGWIAPLGQFMQAIGVFALGAVARDNSVTSEQAGAKTP